MVPCSFAYSSPCRTSILKPDTILETHPVIILCHGNACDVGRMLTFAKALSLNCASHVCLMEYPGYGLARGKPTEESCMMACVKLIDHLHDTMKIPFQNMIFYGQSIGSGLAAATFAHCVTKKATSPAALILISPYLSIKALAGEIAWKLRIICHGTV